MKTLRQWFNANNLTLIKVAADSGCSRRTVWRALNGHLPKRAKTVKRLAIECDLDERKFRKLVLGSQFEARNPETLWDLIPEPDIRTEALEMMARANSAKEFEVARMAAIQALSVKVKQA